LPDGTVLVVEETARRERFQFDCSDSALQRPKRRRASAYCSRTTERPLRRTIAGIEAVAEDAQALDFGGCHGDFCPLRRASFWGRGGAV